jgi:hypothetical protein
MSSRNTLRPLANLQVEADDDEKQLRKKQLHKKRLRQKQLLTKKKSFLQPPSCSWRYGGLGGPLRPRVTSGGHGLPRGLHVAPGGRE